MLLATMNTSRGRLLATGRPEEDAVHDLARSTPRVVLTEVADEAAVALLVVRAPGVEGGERLDQLLRGANKGAGRLLGELEVDAALTVRVVVVVVDEEDHRPAGVGEV